ncbi:hypothetical protein D3C86_1846360 [compost metagenome]
MVAHDQASFEICRTIDDLNADIEHAHQPTTAARGVFRKLMQAFLRIFDEKVTCECHRQKNYDDANKPNKS